MFACYSLLEKGALHQKFAPSIVLFIEKCPFVCFNVIIGMFGSFTIICAVLFCCFSVAAFFIFTKLY